MHLTLGCSFAKEIWFHFQGSNNRMWRIASSASSITDWWRELCSERGPTNTVQEDITLAAYIAWHLWNERNRRIFQQKELTVFMLADLINDNVKLYKEATGQGQVIT